MYFDKMDVVIDTYRNKQKGWSFAYYIFTNQLEKLEAAKAA